MPWTRADLLAELARVGIEATTHDHRAVFTVAESEDVKNHLPGTHSKNLFVKDKKGRIFLISAESHAAIDLKTVSAKIGASGRVSFCRAEQLAELLGVQPGSVTPFGIVNDHDRLVTVILDESLMQNELLNFHPLENTATTAIRRDDLVRFLTHCGHPPQIVAVSDGTVDESDGEA